MKYTFIVLAIFSVIIFLITAFWEFVSSHIFPNTSLGLYDREFFQNVLINAHGSAIDIFVISIILYWFEQRKKKSEDIEETIQELQYLKYYKGEDISYRYFGRLKKLNDSGVKTIDLPEAQLANIDIQGITLLESNLIAANIKNTIISSSLFYKCNLEAAQFVDSKIKTQNNIIFDKCNLSRTNFYKAQLKGIDFRTCEIKYAKFENANLMSADFRSVDCKGVNFKNANLRSANFKGARNLTQEMLNEAACIKDIKR